MEKILLKRKTVLECGVIIKKWYCNKKMLKHPKNANKGLIFGWNIEGDKECTPACPGASSEGYYLCIGGNCVFFPIG